MRRESAVSSRTSAAIRDDRGYADFMQILTHDDRSSRYIMASAMKEVEGGWTQRAHTAARIRRYAPTGWEDTYVTVNGFFSHERTAERCRQVNAMSFDVDAHGEGGATPAEIAEAVMSAVRKGNLPEPTMLVNSGRGVQLHYVLRHSIPCYLTPNEDGQPMRNEKALAFFTDVRRRLAAALDSVIESLSGVENDRSVFDLAHVFRVPGTFNSRSQTYCQLVHLNEDRLYALKELKALSPEPERASSEAAAPRSAKFRSLKFDRVAMHRMRKVEELRDLRDHTPGGRGCTDLARNNMTFVFCNAAVQVYKHKRAIELTHEFNAGFRTPLAASEVDAVIKSVTKNGPYRIGAQKLVDEFLRMSSEEMEAVKLFSTSRQIEREAAKAATREKRAKRDEEVLELLSRGLSQGKTAEIVGISRATVNKIAQRSKLAAAATTASKSLAEIARAALSMPRQAASSKLSIFLARALGCVGRRGATPMAARQSNRQRTLDGSRQRGPPRSRIYPTQTDH